MEESMWHATEQGADWFESALVDYDVCSNWGNWVAAAGLTGGRINHFNITKQSKVIMFSDLLTPTISLTNAANDSHHTPKWDWATWHTALVYSWSLESRRQG
jgi:hypothetical protein